MIRVFIKEKKKDTYCSAVLWDGAFTVKNVVQPSADPWLTGLWINQWRTSSRNRRRNVLFPLLIYFQRSAKCHCEFLPQYCLKSRKRPKTIATFVDFPGCSHPHHTKWAAPEEYLQHQTSYTLVNIVCNSNLNFSYLLVIFATHQ